MEERRAGPVMKGGRGCTIFSRAGYNRFIPTIPVDVPCFIVGMAGNRSEHFSHSQLGSCLVFGIFSCTVAN
eukprot:1233588-Rhodomonas_salina.1